MMTLTDFVDAEADDFERRYDCDRCRDTGQDGDRPCYKCDAAHDLRKPDLIQLIIDEAIHVEPTECDNCSCLSEWGHVGDSGWRCGSCCITRPEWAVSTHPAGWGMTAAYIGSHRIGTIPLPYCSTGVDAAVSRLLDEVPA